MTIHHTVIMCHQRYTQNEKLSNSCQTDCHYDNFMVVNRKVVLVVIGDNQKVVTVATQIWYHVI